MALYGDDYRRQARAIAAGGKGARQAWTELRQWANGKGPVAMKSAMMEFMGAYGGTPEATLIMPEILRGAAVLSPMERGELIRLGKPPAEFSSYPRLGSKPALGQGRPALSLSFQPNTRTNAPRPGVLAPFVPSSDHAYLRDMPVRMRERLEASRPTSLEASAILPQHLRNEKIDIKPVHFDSSRSPDAFVGAQKGENLVRNLIHQVRSHGRGDYLSAPPTAGLASKSASQSRKPKRRLKARVSQRRKPVKALKAKRAKAPANRRTSKVKRRRNRK